LHPVEFRGILLAQSAFFSLLIKNMVFLLSFDSGLMASEISIRDFNDLYLLVPRLS
jgi:hypothetical protein